jgi:ectoine hydroxylase-related dioxygenase (phytanoyl-CoA dioxygenase family)
MADWTTDGYVCVDLGIPDELLEEAKAATLDAPPEFRTQREYEKEGHPRVFQGWKYSEAIATLMTWPTLAGTIEELTGKKASPFQSINFVSGSQQALHQDAIHFDCDPPGHMVGSWIALEAVTPSCGPLVVCPGSHHLPRIGFRNKVEPGGEKQEYAAYERLMEDIGSRYPKVYATMPKGHALIWHGNLLHGGSAIKNPNSTRFSQAVHWVLEGWDRFYCPMFDTDKAVPS